MTLRDTDSAIEDMRLAHSYIDDWVDKKGVHVLGFAAKYIEQARKKDLDAVLSVEITKGENKGEIITYTQDDLGATVLFYQSQMHSYPDAPKKELARAAELLKRAIAYNPYSIQFRRHLADVYLNLHDKRNALAVARDALAVLPRDLEARKLLDYVQSAPLTHPPSFLASNAGCILPATTMGMFLLAVVLLFSGQYSAALSAFIVACIAGGITGLYDSDQMFKKALDREARNRADKK